MEKVVTWRFFIATGLLVLHRDNFATKVFYVATKKVTTRDHVGIGLVLARDFEVTKEISFSRQ